MLDPSVPPMHVHWVLLKTGNLIHNKSAFQKDAYPLPIDRNSPVSYIPGGGGGGSTLMVPRPKWETLPSRENSTFPDTSYAIGKNIVADPGFSR